MCKTLARQQGAHDPDVKRLQMTCWFINRLVLVYIIGDILCNLLKPIIFITIFENMTTSLDAYTWAKSWSLVITMIYLIEINLQQLLILLFYYRLDQQQGAERRNSVLTDAAYSLSSGSSHAHDEITLYSDEVGSGDISSRQISVAQFHNDISQQRALRKAQSMYKISNESNMLLAEEPKEDRKLGQLLG